MTILNQLSAMARDAIRSAEVAALRAIRPAPTPPTVEVAALLAHCAEALHARDAAEAECREAKGQLEASRRALANVREQYEALSHRAATATGDLTKLYAVLGVSCIESAQEIVAELNDVLGVSNLWEARKVAGQLKANVVLSAIKGEGNCVELAQLQAQAKTAKAIADEVFAAFGVTNVFELRQVVVTERDLRQQLANALKLAEERLAHANQLQADIESEQSFRLELRKRFGAKANETMWAFIERLAASEAFLRKVTSGGVIVSSGHVTTDEVSRARATNRMLVLPDGLGFVFVPRRSEKEAQS